MKKEKIIFAIQTIFMIFFALFLAGSISASVEKKPITNWFESLHWFSCLNDKGPGGS